MERKTNKHNKIAITSQDKMTKQNGFINVISLVNCTICKVSLVALILLSFLVVNPQKPAITNHKPIQDSLKNVAKDTIKFGRQINDSRARPATADPAVLKH
ncbi:hypothetical protein L21SP5_01800 [Salinivirga cyanobacteriivorans]|uniref:Uncharacterized protein n=1 Tax=Salinivirga cyanobacteriivorans TaxID=1307839 RepID=A0A0S2HZK1_9BACT|nr:hypothetical protein [Salinivirga cyanobacteriivorans]ALO15441.1 hypothetical protein L21SP5_01800 [Salinivirga cyanobacteriivorans]